MQRFMPLLAASALVLSTTAAQADLGDQLFKLLPDDGAAGDRFGISVAICGTTAIVGAYWDDDSCPKDSFCDSGSAYLFDTTTGQQIAKLLPDDGAENDQFGYVSISGTTAIVGAPGDDDNGDISGSAYLFDTTTGRQIAKLLADDGEALDIFGIRVAISGATAIVGSPRDDDHGSDSGSAYLFDTTTGHQLAKLLPDDGETLEFFGISVAISGTTAIVGAYWDDDSCSKDPLCRSGSAYLFDTTTGQQTAKLLPNDGAAGDWFGISVAIGGTTAIVGASHHDEDYRYSGSAYLFDTTTGQQIAKLLPDDGYWTDFFGRSVAISGTTAIVGATHDDDNGLNSGSAYLFDISDAANPTQIAKLLADDGAELDYFGQSVAISGATVMVGARRDDDNGTDSGSAYLFDAAAAPACPWDFDDDGAVGASDLAVLLGSWGPCPGCPADVDGDGDVDAADLATLLGNWGRCP